MQKIKCLFLFFSVFTIYLNASERPRWITETPSATYTIFTLALGEVERPFLTYILGADFSQRDSFGTSVPTFVCWNKNIVVGNYLSNCSTEEMR